MKKKEKIINIIAGLLYYPLSIYLFYNLFLITIIVYLETSISPVLYIFLYLVLPLLLLILPIIICIKKEKIFYKSILIGLLAIGVYLVIITILRAGLFYYFEKFTPEKWEKYSDLRNNMIDDLEKKYKIVGMSKTNAISLLGTPEETNKGICYYEYQVIFTDYYYCLSYDENNIITETNSYKKGELHFIKD